MIGTNKLVFVPDEALHSNLIFESKAVAYQSGACCICPPFRVGSKISQGLSRTNALAYFVRYTIDNKIFLRQERFYMDKHPSLYHPEHHWL